MLIDRRAEMDALWRKYVAPNIRLLMWVVIICGLVLNVFSFGSVELPRTPYWIVTNIATLVCALGLAEIRRLRAGGVD